MQNSQGLLHRIVNGFLLTQCITLTLPPTNQQTIVAPPPYWKEHWRGHSLNLTLVHSNEHVAVYFDPDVDRSITWPFEFLSAAWSYSKNTFGEFFGADPHLYFIFHHSRHDNGRCEGAYFEAEFDYRNVGDFAARYPNQLKEFQIRINGTDLYVLGAMLWTIQQRAITKFRKWPAENVSHYRIEDLGIYDLYLAIGKREDAQKYLEEKLQELHPYPRNDTYWFRDWSFPIYSRYGGASVLRKFYLLLQWHWPRGESEADKYDPTRQMKLGEFIHFWCGAAEEDLSYLARVAFGRGNFQNELVKARKDFPHFNYSVVIQKPTAGPPPLFWSADWNGRRGNLSLAYQNDRVAFYFDTDIKERLLLNNPQNFRPFQLISKAWIYLHTKFAVLRQSPDPRLFIVFDNDKSLRCNSASYLSQLYDSKNTIQCGLDFSFNFSSSLTTAEYYHNLKNVMHSIASLVIKNSVLLKYEPNTIVNLGVFEELPPQTLEDIIEFPEKLSQVITLDLFRNVVDGLRLGGWSHLWRNATISNTESIPQIGTFWLRDWYFPIYEQYGGIASFDNFCSIVTSSIDEAVSGDPNFKSKLLYRKLNFGKFIHFWSGAVKKNLRPLAVRAFGWNQGYSDQLKQARFDFPKIHYPDSSSDQFSIATIISILAGILFLALVIICSGVIVHKRKIRNLRLQIQELKSKDVEEFYEGNSNLNPREHHSRIQSLPYNQDFELTEDELIINFKKILGSGQYGIVYYGYVNGIFGDQSEPTPVAVKTIKPHADVSYFKALLSELKIMTFVGKHENIVELLGARTKNIRNKEIFVAVEFCENGDLRKCLKRNRKSFHNLFEDSQEDQRLSSHHRNSHSVTVGMDSASIPLKVLRVKEYGNAISRSSNVNYGGISTLNLIEWSRQISNGMNYLTTKKVIHGDLAARNVLLTANNVAKIADFGLSRQLLNYSNYMKTSTTPLPWRWMAIESLKDMEYSVKSDVWSFGVTLWELFSLGHVPYPGTTWNVEFVNQLSQGTRLPSPSFANSEIYELMLGCWTLEPNDRISFETMTTQLTQTLFSFNDNTSSTGYASNTFK